MKAHLKLFKKFVRACQGLINAYQALIKACQLNPASADQELPQASAVLLTLDIITNNTSTNNNQPTKIYYDCS